MRRLPLLLLLPARGAGSATVDFDAAVRAGDVAAVVGHLDAGRDVEGQSMGSTPLLRAVAHRRVAVARALLDRGADPDVRGSGMRSPLAVAARCAAPGDDHATARCAAIAQALVEHGADPTLVAAGIGKSARDIARTNKRHAILELFGEGGGGAGEGSAM